MPSARVMSRTGRQADVGEDPDRRGVARLRQRRAQRDRAEKILGVVLGLPGEAARVVLVDDRGVLDDRRGRVAARERRRVDDRLERRPGLAARLQRAVELALREAVAADDRLQLGLLEIDRDAASPRRAAAGRARSEPPRLRPRPRAAPGRPGRPRAGPVRRARRARPLRRAPGSPARPTRRRRFRARCARRVRARA